MKTNYFLVLVLSMALLFGGYGCGSTAANVGAGAGLGAAISQTLQGADADLARREEKLIALYNAGVEDGMQQENLDEIEKSIYDTRLARQGLDTGKKLFGVDWSDPAQTGGAIGLVSTLAYAFLKRKELVTVSKKYKAAKRGEAAYMRTVRPEEAAKLYHEVGEARKDLKIV